MRRTTTLLAVVLLLAAAGSARAAFPGKNGDIVFRSNRTGDADIYTMHADGSNRVDLTRNPAEDVDPRWSPDGTRIVFASNRTGSYQLYTMAADGSDVRRVTSLAGDSHRPTWTADGRILFQNDSTDPGNSRDVYSVAADGSGLTDLTPAPSDDLNAAAAPHGNRIAFSSNRDGGYHLYVQSAGSALRELTSGDGFDFQPNWSPSGNDLVFLHVDPSFSDGDIEVVHANGSIQRLTSTPTRFETEPVWSPDGTKIAFHGCSAQDGCVDYVMNADGTGETVVTKTFTAPFVDDFSSTPLSDFWSTQLVGSGTSVSQTNGRLVFDLSASATADPGAGYANPSVFSVCNLRGDFDMQVDYDLLTQPFPDFVNPLFNEGNFVNGQWQSADGIFLSKWGISGNFDGIPFAGFVPNVPPQGSMRLVRQGSTLTASFSTDGTTWQQLQTRNDLVADESDVALSLFSNNLPGTDARAAFDNFRVNSGTFSCPTWWDDNAPDWGTR